MATTPSIEPEDWAPTHAQRLMLAGQQLSPGIPLYNQAFAFHINGALDAKRLSDSFAELVRHADSLRTVVVPGQVDQAASSKSASLQGQSNQEGPWQDPWRLRIAAAEAPVEPLPLIDFSTSSNRRQEAERWLQERSARPMELDRRLYDAALLKLSAERWILYFCQHHVVTDARSMMILFRRLSALYQGIPCQPLPSFHQLWQHQQEQCSQPDTKALDHWQQVAKVATPPPSFYGRSAQSSAGTRIDLDLGEDRGVRLLELARHRETGALSLDLGLFNLLATWLLAFEMRLTGVERSRPLALGAPSHNRSTPALTRHANLLIEVFPVSVAVDPEVDARLSFVELLGRVRTASLEFLRHAGIGRSGGRQNRGVQTILNFVRGSFGDFAGFPVTTRWLYSGHHDRQHAMRLQVHDFDNQGRLQLQLDLNNDVFDPQLRKPTVDRLLRLLDTLLDDWHRPIVSVPLVEPRQAHQALAAMGSIPPLRLANSHAGDCDSVIHWIRRRADQDPQATALRYGRTRVSLPDSFTGKVTSLSRGELELACDRLARQLRRLAPGPFVGLHMGRSLGAVVAALAVMRAGAAYVPIDPAWPEARKSWVLNDAQIRVVLGTPPGEGIPDLQTYVLDAEFQIADAPSCSPSGQAPLPLPDSQDAAYLLYTSGSTGQPKGVVISHGALAHYIQWAKGRYTVEGAAHFPLFSPLTFDLTVTSIFAPLVTGGQVVIYPQTSPQGDLAFLDVVADDAVDIVKLTPSHLSLLQEPRIDQTADSNTATTRLQRLIFGGEALTPRAAHQARAIFGDRVVIHNEYGPTEATVGCIEGTFDPLSRPGATVPIGRPIAEATVWLLDEFLNPLPEGVIGELYLAGPGLASGYWQRPALTAERFVPNPFTDQPTRLYRTGDRARLRRRGKGPDLELEYLGRIDDQVKIRGARLELGEVKAALLEHPGVANAEVLAVQTLPRAADSAALLADSSSGQTEHCRDCGLGSDFPAVDFDSAGVCNHCRAFTGYRSRVDDYFRTLDQLRQRLDRPAADTEYHCVALLSGGKDSTYALCRLVDMGYRVLAFTLDNGYISDQAKANIRRVVEALGVDHVFGSTPAMNKIFADSLRRYSNVCQGCFKTLYTLSLKLAYERRIPHIVTGLSRGQLFETRLTPELFQGFGQNLGQGFGQDLGLDPEQIDRTVLKARKAYHRADDAVSQLLDVSHLENDHLFDQIEFIDFYRYCDVDLDEMMSYLEHRVPWSRPTDTGRSTNCLINDLGIWVHRRERGFHNYALPYSWDVRLGHKTRQAALDELDDQIDEDAVLRMMAEVGYQPARPFPFDSQGNPSRENAGSNTPARNRLVAWYVPAEADEVEGAAKNPNVAELRAFVEQRLPDFMVPSQFQAVGSLPLTTHGKVDRRALEAGLQTFREEDLGEPYSPPKTPLQRALADLWASRLGVERVGLNDNFYKLGGDSILAIRVAAAGHRQGIPLEPAEIFEAPTVAQLAAVLDQRRSEITLNAPSVPGPIALSPSQLWCLDHLPDPSQPWHQVVKLRVEGLKLQAHRLEPALHALAQRHEALRLKIHADGRRSAAELVADARPVLMGVGTDAEKTVEHLLHNKIDLQNPPLLAAALIDGRTLVLVAHHLAIDALSWPILLQDLADFYQDPQVSLPPAPSWRQWLQEQTSDSSIADSHTELAFWDSLPRAEPDSSSVSSSQGIETPSAADAGEMELDVERTSHIMARRAGSGAQGVLLAAVAGCVADWSGNQNPVMFVEHHGRIGDSQAAGTVGWLSHLHPIAFDLRSPNVAGQSLNAHQLLERVDQAMAGLPNSGAGFGRLRHLSFRTEVRGRMAKLENAAVLVNFLGRAEALVPQGLFSLASPLALVRGSNLPHPFALEVDAWVLDGRLQVRWTYWRAGAPSWLTPESLAGQAVELETRLIQLVDDGLSTAGPRAEDFPLANLDKTKMGKLAALLGGSKP